MRHQKVHGAEFDTGQILHVPGTLSYFFLGAIQHIYITDLPTQKPAMSIASNRSFFMCVDPGVLVSILLSKLDLVRAPVDQIYDVHSDGAQEEHELNSDLDLR